MLCSFLAKSKTRKSLWILLSRSTLAAEVEAPGRTFPKALAGAVVLVVAMYVLPLAACLGVMPDALDWQLGFFATVAGNVGGPWLSWALVAAAAVSQVGLATLSLGHVALHCGAWTCQGS